MLSSAQILILTFIVFIFVYIITDRICRCIEITKNSGFNNFMNFIKGNNDNGDKPV